VSAGEKPTGVPLSGSGRLGAAAEMKSVKRVPQKRPCMNPILQAYEDAPMIIDASGWIVLLASLVITVGWLWYLYR
jgi:hypothetical protein